MNKLTKYIKEAYAEMRKVTWPTKKETTRYTFMVIGVSIAVAAFLGLLDMAFSYSFTFVF